MFGCMFQCMSVICFSVFRLFHCVLCMFQCMSVVWFSAWISYISVYFLMLYISLYVLYALLYVSFVSRCPKYLSVCFVCMWSLPVCSDVYILCFSFMCGWCFVVWSVCLDVMSCFYVTCLSVCRVYASLSITTYIAMSYMFIFYVSSHKIHDVFGFFYDYFSYFSEWRLAGLFSPLILLCIEAARVAVNKQTVLCIVSWLSVACIM